MFGTSIVSMFCAVLVVLLASVATSGGMMAGGPSNANFTWVTVWPQPLKAVNGDQNACILSSNFTFSTSSASSIVKGVSARLHALT